MEVQSQSVGANDEGGQDRFLLEAPEETLSPPAFHILEAPEFLGSSASSRCKAPFQLLP